MKDEQKLTEFGKGAEQVERSIKAHVIMHMESGGRIRVYKVMSTLLDCGFDVVASSKILADQYRASGLDLDANVVEKFFGNFDRDLTSEQLLSLAAASFGSEFLGPEERTLISCMARSPNLAAHLKGMADIVESIHS